MISLEAQKKIKKQIGPNYTNKILEYFEENGILKEDGSSYSDAYIRAILSKRKLSNYKLEAAIFDCFAHYKKLNEEELKRRKEILES